MREWRDAFVAFARAGTVTPSYSSSGSPCFSSGAKRRLPGTRPSTKMSVFPERKVCVTRLASNATSRPTSMPRKKVTKSNKITTQKSLRCALNSETISRASMSPSTAETTMSPRAHLGR